MKLTRWLYVVLAVAVAIWAFGYFTSDERRLARRLDELGGLLAKDTGESDLTAANKARQLGELFAHDFEITVLPIGQTIRDRQELARLALFYRRSRRSIDVDFYDLETEIDKRRRSATTAAAVQLSATGEGGLERERYRLRLEWREDNGAWRLFRFEVVEVLEGGASLL